MTDIRNYFKNVTLLEFTLSLLLAIGTSAGTFSEASSDLKKFFQLNKSKIQIEVPANWQVAEYLMNAPLTLLGPARNGIRPVINLLSTGISTAGSDQEAFRNDQKSWEQGRRQFLKENGGALQQFYPYHDETWPSGALAHVLGYRYQLGEAVIISKSYYVECKAHYFLIKSVVRAENEEEFSPIVNEVLRSFGCE